MNLWIGLTILLIGLLLAGIGAVLYRYTRDFRAARKRIDGLGSQVIQTDCGPVEYARLGEGCPLLVVHGAMGGFDQGLWLARSFEVAKYPLIAVSRFGYLGSPLPPNANLDAQADAFAALLDALEIPRAVVFAVSAGSTSAIRFAARHPRRVIALVLVGPDAPGAHDVAMPPRFIFDTLLRSDFAYWALVTFFGKWVQNKVGLVPKGYALTPDQQAMLDKVQLGDLPVSRRMDGMIFETYTTLDEYNASVTPATPLPGGVGAGPYPLCEIQTPTLVIHALDDPLSVPENVRRLAGQMPNARLFSVADGGHFFFGHAAEVKAEIALFLRDFLAGVTGDGSYKKKLLFSLVGGAVLALAVQAIARKVSHPSRARAERDVKPGSGLVSGPACFSDIDGFIKAQMKRLNIPGAALAIVEGDQIVHLRGFTRQAGTACGQARPAGEAPTPQTPFFIGSLTKSITALAVMQLVEAGKLELDAPVQRYLPWFYVLPPKGAAADPDSSTQITLRHLLNQTSGLPLIPSEIALADFDDRPGAIERQVRALSGVKLAHLPGSKCEYSNFNYNVLGLIVEAASGETYPAYVQKHIFEPLEMTHSYTSRDEARQNGLAMGYRHWFGIPFPAPRMRVPYGSLPSGQLISSAEDMAHYLIAHLNGGRYKDEQVLSGAGMDELHRGAAEFNMAGVSAGRYAMGWFDIDLSPTKTYTHSGNVPDFSAFMALIPGQKRGAALLFNADPYGMPPITEEVGMGVTALLAGQPPAPIRLDFIQWIMRLLPLVPILQIAGTLATLRHLSLWRADPALRPASRRLWGEHILLPLLPNLALAAVLVCLRSSGLIRFLGLFMPDLAWIARISGGFAGVWAVLRTGLLLQALLLARKLS